MKINDNCSQCPKKAGCKEVYERLGHSDAPSVVGKVFLAFLLPIGLFVGLLVGTDRLLPAFESEPLRTLTMFGLSLGPTLAALWLLKWLRSTRRHGN